MCHVGRWNEYGQSILNRLVPFISFLIYIYIFISICIEYFQMVFSFLLSDLIFLSLLEEIHYVDRLFVSSVRLFGLRSLKDLV